MRRRLLVLNGLATLGAVVNHSTGWGFTAMFAWTHRYLPVQSPGFAQMGSVSYYALRAAEQLIMFSVPSFLFVSGFFVAFAAGPQRDNISWNTVSSRTRNLIVPYLVWCTVIFVWRGLQGSFETPFRYFKQILTGRAAPPYYYVPLIIQFFLISPLFVPLLKKRWGLALLAVGVMQFTAQLAQYPVILGSDCPLAAAIVKYAPSFTLPLSAFWFAFGVFAGFNLPMLKQWLVRYGRVLPWVTLLLAILAFLEWEVLFRRSGAQWLPPHVTLLDSLYAGGFILSFLALEEGGLPCSKALGELGSRSFGIYLIHAPVLELVSRTAYHYSPGLLGHQILFQPLLVGVGVGIPVLLMSVVNRSPARRAYRYLFG